MNTRALTLLTIAASAITLSTTATLHAAGNQAPVHTSSADSEPSDTLIFSTAKTLIESISELSKTTTKLSETANKLLDSELKTPAEKVRSEKTPEGIYYIPDSEDDAEAAVTTPVFSNGVYIGDDRETAIPGNGKEWIMPDSLQSGGSYFWIPEKDKAAVEAILNGEIPFTKLRNKQPDLNEIVYWRGDSVRMALPTKRLGRFDRKLYNWLIYPKGLWHISLTANYGELSTDDSEFLSLIQDVDMKGKIYSIKPSVSYFLRNNACVGLRLAFSKGEMGINSFKVDIDEDMSFNLHDIKYTSDSYSAAIFYQQYFGLTRRGRFAVFNEAELSIGTGNSHFIRPFDGELRDTRTKSQSFNINYSPGVSIMMMKNAAFNLSFGIFGFHLKNEKQWENGEDAGSRFTSGINFRFNLFNINFGVSIII